MTNKSKAKSKASHAQKQAKTLSTKASTARSEAQPSSCYVQRCHLESAKFIEFAASWEISLKSFRLLRYAHYLLKHCGGDLNRWHYHSLETLAELLEMPKCHFYGRLEPEFIRHGYISKQREHGKRGDTTSWRRLGPVFDKFRGRCAVFDLVKTLYELPVKKEWKFKLLEGGGRYHGGTWGRYHGGTWGRYHGGTSKYMNLNYMKLKEEEESPFPLPDHVKTENQNQEAEDMRNLTEELRRIAVQVDGQNARIASPPKVEPSPFTRVKMNMEPADPPRMAKSPPLSEKQARAKVWSLIGSREATATFPAEIKARIFDVIDDKNRAGLVPVLLARLERFMKVHEYQKGVLVEDGETLTPKGFYGLIKLLSEEEIDLQGCGKQAH